MIVSYIIVMASCLAIVAVIALYLFSRGKYKDMTSPLSPNEWAFLFMLPIGLYLMDLVKYTYSHGDRRLRESFSELYGEKYSLFYLRVHIANKISTAIMFLLIVSIVSLYVNLQPSEGGIKAPPPTSLAEGLIPRPEFNLETYKGNDASLSLRAEIDAESPLAKSYDIKVPMQRPDDETCVDIVIKDIEENYIGPNEERYKGGVVAASGVKLNVPSGNAALGCEMVLVAESGEQGHVSENGGIERVVPGSQPIDMRLSWRVSKGGVAKQTKSFDITLLPDPKFYEESLDQAVNGINSGNSDLIGDDYIKPPSSSLNAEVLWAEPEQEAQENVIAYKYLVFIVGLFIAAFVFVIMDSQVDDRIKKKRDLIKNDFPDFISKYVLLLGCGMTTYDSFAKILKDTQNKNTLEQHPLYAELETAMREVDLGKSEVFAYEDFGLRCRISETMKFASLVTQNLRRGTDDMLILLKEQMNDVWQFHKADVRRKGEEAGTKLVFPMILSLGSVLLVVIYPAFTSMVF